MTSEATLWSKDASQRAGSPLLLLFHGYGANEADLFGLAEELPAEFTVASVRAGLAAGPGYAWFPLGPDGEGGLSFDPQEVKRVSAEIGSWIDSVRGEHSSVSLLGFSQGMAIVSTLARHRPTDFAAVVGLSGFVLDTAEDDFFRDQELAARKLPFFWGRDQADPVVPQPLVESSNAWLPKHTVLTKVLYNGMWHGISAAEIKHVSEFLTATVLAE
ncbi:phospholipase/carboxylesterase [Psychromicrobium silvestre]|uniref:Phospholipase/carboxylesterase n=1 Tax=Psychromicrobium silvestre TaxID=1645614 RepID=A0A7Y9LVZ6_9MICC|nr:alpha/beta hydrolase-fold protein [Psychromicrobium silvestre]NYE96625.1 phospholipase/carboxylesterase [Psychromicrobium silvestre]